MPQYGARVEYALHTLLNLSLAPTGTAPSARDLADFQKLPVAFIRKLLTQLEKSGLVLEPEGSPDVIESGRITRNELDADPLQQGKQINAESLRLCLIQAGPDL